MIFKNGVKNIQAAAYNGAHTVFEFEFHNITYFRLLPMHQMLRDLTKSSTHPVI